MKKFLSILILSSLFGCATFSKKISFKNQIILNKETITNINGSYAIKSNKTIWRYENIEPEFTENDTTNRFPLYTTLKANNQYGNAANIENYSAKIEIRTKKIISISLLNKEKIIDSINLNYKIKKNGYIYLKNKNFKTKWIPGLCGNFELDRTRIGLTKENNLILNHSYFIYGAALFIIGDTKKTSFGTEYKRIK